MIIKKLASISFIKTIAIILLSTIFLSACGDTPTECKGITAQEFEDAGVADGDCSAYKIAKQRECWQADILDIIYTAMGTITMDAYEKLTQGAMSVMMVLFSIWFTISLIKYLGSIKEEESPGAYWTTVLRKFFLCVVCGMIASSSTNLIFILNNVIYPVFNAFLELASYLLAQTSQETSKGNFTFFGDEYSASQEVCSVTEQLGQQIKDGQFPEGANKMMQCLTCNISDKLNIGFTLSFKLMAIGVIIPKLIGFTILAAFTFVKLGFVFYLIEALFKFTMMVVMLPIFIMGYAFEQTRGWMVNGFKVILAGAAYMLAISVVISLSIVAIVQLITGYPEIFNAPVTEFIEFTPVIMVLLMLAFLIKSTMKVASDTSNMFISAKITTKFQEMLGGILAMIAKGIGVALTAGAAAPVFEKIKIIKKIKDGIEKANEKINQAKEKIQELAGEDNEYNENKENEL